MKRTVDNSRLMLVADYKLADMSVCQDIDILQIEVINNCSYIVEVIKNETSKQ